MQLALVIGRATATIKHGRCTAINCCWCSRKWPTAGGRTGRRCWSSTRSGPGIGETVMITSDGRGARELLGIHVTPVAVDDPGNRGRMNSQLPRSIDCAEVLARLQQSPDGSPTAPAGTLSAPSAAACRRRPSTRPSSADGGKGIW